MNIDKFDLMNWLWDEAGARKETSEGDKTYVIYCWVERVLTTFSRLRKPIGFDDGLEILELRKDTKSKEMVSFLKELITERMK